MLGYHAEMRSPFPGMDPYLEGFWNNVHGPLSTCIADELNESLPYGLRAAMRPRKLLAHSESRCTAGDHPLTLHCVEIRQDSTSMTWPWPGRTGNAPATG